MAKHNAVAQGDRHVPWDRSFADEATRLAYSYTANDIGHWFKDVDTGFVYELLTTTPTFQRAGRPDNIVSTVMVAYENAAVFYENEVVIYNG